MDRKAFHHAIERFISGDCHAFDAVFTEYYHKCVGAAFLVLHNKEEAQNAAGDVFLKLIKNPNVYLQIENPSSYLFTAAQNAAKDILKKSLQAFRYRQSYVPYGHDAFSESNAMLDFYALLNRQFNEREQEMLVLRTVWQQTYCQIAYRCGVPVAHVKYKFKIFKKRLNPFFKK